MFYTLFHLAVDMRYEMATRYNGVLFNRCSVEFITWNVLS